MSDIGVRSIGIKRAQCHLMLKGLTYDFNRTAYLLKVQFWKCIDRVGAPIRPRDGMAYRWPENALGATENDIECDVMPPTRSAFR